MHNTGILAAVMLDTKVKPPILCFLLQASCEMDSLVL